MMAVEVQTEPNFSPGVPQVLFSISGQGIPRGTANEKPTVGRGGGGRFLMIRDPGASSGDVDSINLVLQLASGTDRAGAGSVKS